MSSEPDAKRQKTDDDESESPPSVVPDQGDILQQLHAVQADLNKVNEDCSERILEVEASYGKRMVPMYAKRNKQIKKFDQFWFTAILNHCLLTTAVPEEHERFVSTLREVEVHEDFDNIRSGFKIIMTFGPNDYFENEVVTKTYRLDTDPPTTEISEIQWKEDMKPPVPTEDGTITLLEWLAYASPPDRDEIADAIKDDLYKDPVHYYAMPNTDQGQPGPSDAMEGFLSESRKYKPTGEWKPIVRYLNPQPSASSPSKMQQPSTSSALCDVIQIDDDDDDEESADDEGEDEEVEGEEVEGEEVEVEGEEVEVEGEEVEGEEQEDGEDVEDEEESADSADNEDNDNEDTVDETDGEPTED